MNHIYRVIFNRHTSTFQAVAETTKSQGKTHSQKISSSSTVVSKLVLRPLSVVIGLLVGSVAVAAPTGGEVVAGAANIHQAGNITNINQSSQNAAINWQQFGIKAHETVNFNQPNVNAVTLNRVIGNEKSVIDGVMNANGKVFIQNANGTLIGKNAQINVGGLVATTAKISDEDFMSGNYRFTGATGSIENLGDIKVPKGGVVALIAPIVKNSGTITAHGADTLLASAESFSITLPNDGQFSYTLDKGTLQGLVDNGGAILADGGRVVLTTKGIDTVKKSIIKHSGVIEANTIKNNNGVIELLGDLDNSELHLTGTLKAEGKGTDDGGFIETSAAKLNIDDKAHISTQSEQGKTGTWLIDPKDFTVAPKGGDTTGAKVSQGLQNNNVQLKSREGAIEGKGDVIINDEISWNKNKLTLTADNDIHINKTLNGTGTASLALEYGQRTADGKVEVVKDGKSEKQDNDYYLQKDTPLASRTVKVNLPAGKNFSTKKGRNGEVEVYDVIHEMPKIVKGFDGDWESKFTTDKIAFGSDLDVSHTKNHESFVGWRLPRNKDNKLSAKIHGLGHVVDGLWLRSKKTNQPTGLFQLNDVDGLFRDIGVTNVDIQSQGYDANTGGLVGDGYNIHNSYATGTVSTTGKYADAGGLVGYGENIHNSYATGTVSTTGYDADAGGLVGLGSNIHNSYATGTVSTTGEIANAGGLVALGSNIHNSYATGTVSTTGEIANAGGLVGAGHTIHNSYANNQVSATDQRSIQGGVVGYYRFDEPSTNTFFNHSKNPTLKAVGEYSSRDQSKITNVTGKTEAELKQKVTFKDWDFDKVWRISEGSDMPRLRALTQGTIIITPTPPTNPTPPTTPKTDLGIQAHNLNKTYDGKAVNTEDDLRAIATDKNNGFKDIVEVIGLKDGDQLSTLGKLTYGGSWKGAKNAGKYSILPSGLNGGQKYEIKYGEGSLTIDPKSLTIYALSNFKDDNQANPTSDKIGISALGLVDGDKIKSIDITYSNPNPISGLISINPSNVIFDQGLTSNYTIQYKNGYLVTLPSDKTKQINFPKSGKDFDIKDDETKSKIMEWDKILSNVQDELFLSELVYNNDFGEKILENIKDNRGNKKFTLFKDSILNKKISGLEMAAYKNNENNKYYFVYRGSEVKINDWITNIATTGIFNDLTPSQYSQSVKHTKNLIDNIIKKDVNAEIVFTGHSLGGSLASYNGAINGNQNIEVVTFNPAPLRPQLWIDIRDAGDKTKSLKKVTNLVFSNDILQTLDSFGSGYLANSKEHIRLFTNGKINDHLFTTINPSNQSILNLSNNYKIWNTDNMVTIRPPSWKHISFKDKGYFTDKSAHSLVTYGSAKWFEYRAITGNALRSDFGDVYSAVINFSNNRLPDIIKNDYLVTPIIDSSKEAAKIVVSNVDAVAESMSPFNRTTKLLDGSTFEDSIKNFADANHKNLNTFMEGSEFIAINLAMNKITLEEAEMEFNKLKHESLNAVNGIYDNHVKGSLSKRFMQGLTEIVTFTSDESIQLTSQIVYAQKTIQDTNFEKISQWAYSIRKNLGQSIVINLK